MRKTVRLYSEVGPEERLGRAVASLPPSVRAALAQVADREDLPLVSGVWRDQSGGCLVANVVATLEPAGETNAETLDLRVLRILPELSSRELNRLIVAWDEAAAQEGRDSDAALRRLLRGALAWGGGDRSPESHGRPHQDEDAEPGGDRPDVQTARAATAGAAPAASRPA